MLQNKPGKKLCQGLAFFLTAALTATASPAGLLAHGLAQTPPVYDESYYGTLDYYGTLLESSVVKSYRLSDAQKEILDYGTYHSIVNMTDYILPAQGQGSVRFTFGDKVPERFYFEGKTTEPYRQLPWQLDVSYRLNGVPCQAEALAGKTGLIEILIDAVPNPEAPEYYRNNLILQAVTVLDNDEILSVEAPGAQVQTLGNLKAVLFLAFPGEEQHFILRIGSNDFSFPGLTFLMVPGTLSQLEQVAELRETKEKLEDSAEAVNRSADVILNTLEGLSQDLTDTAEGLSLLNQARDTLSQGKDTVYESADKALVDLGKIADSLEFLPYHFSRAQSFLTDSTDRLDRMVKTAVSLKEELKATRSVIHNLQGDTENLRDMVNDVEWRSWGAAHTAGSLGGDFDRLGNQLDALNASLERLQSIAGSLAEADIQGPIADMVNGTTINEKTLAEIDGIVAMVEQARTALEQALGQAPDTEQLTAAIAQSLISQGLSEEEAIRQAASAVALSETMAGLSGTPEEIMDQINGLIRSLGSSGVSGRLDTLLSSVSGTLNTMNSHNGEIAAALYDLDDLGDVLEEITKILDQSLDQLEELNQKVDSYIPDAQLALEDARRLSEAAVSGIDNTQTFLNSLKDLMKESGSELDAGTEATLNSLEGALEQAVTGLNQTHTLRSAKNTVKKLIDEEWEEHTGQLDNLLRMDPAAEPVSLTSPDNPPPQSLQILLRTESIRSDSQESTLEVDESFQAQGSFFSRIAGIFRAIWDTVSGWFQG